MTTATLDAAPMHRGNWLRRSEQWLDQRGKVAWIAAMVLGFIVFWPIGLALLAYMIWSKRMFNGSCAMRTRHAHTAFKAPSPSGERGLGVRGRFCLSKHARRSGGTARSPSPPLPRGGEGSAGTYPPPPDLRV